MRLRKRLAKKKKALVFLSLTTLIHCIFFIAIIVLRLPALYANICFFLAKNLQPLCKKFIQRPRREVKMAKETAKRNLRTNIARMRVFAMITAAVNAFYVFVILYRNGGLPSFKDLMAISFWAGQEYIAYNTLNRLAQPTLSPEGDLLDCIDASNPKELGYYTFVQDTLWVCWVVQLFCILHPAFFVFYLPVPATLLYKVWGSVLQPLVSMYFSRRAGGEASEGNGGCAPRNRQERRKEELKQRKASRRGRVEK